MRRRTTVNGEAFVVREFLTVKRKAVSRGFGSGFTVPAVSKRSSRSYIPGLEHHKQHHELYRGWDSTSGVTSIQNLLAPPPAPLPAPLLKTSVPKTPVREAIPVPARLSTPTTTPGRL